MKSTDFSALVVELVLEGDGLQQHGALGLEQARAVPEVAVEERRADRLDHLDGDQLVVLARRGRHSDHDSSSTVMRSESLERGDLAHARSRAARAEIVVVVTRQP